jgi:restriction system protein
MTFLDAAYKVLSDAKIPLHYIEIYIRAKKAGLLETAGLTPEASMGSRLYVDTSKPKSKFRRAGKGVFTLKTELEHDIVKQIDDINYKSRARLKALLLKIPPERFEALISELMLALGFDESTIKITPFGNDKGIDVYGILRAGGITEIKAAVQVKRWKNNIQAPIVRDLRGSLTVHQQGIIITTSDFSAGARKEAEELGKTRISLINGEQLVELLVQYEIGIKRAEYIVETLDEEWWKELVDEPSPVVPLIAPVDPPVAPSVLKETFPLPISAKFKGNVYNAALLSQDGQILFDNQVYETPSSAGKKVTGWKAVDGWMFWSYKDSETGEWKKINSLRTNSLRKKHK